MKSLIFILILLMIALHQDVWLWGDRRLLFGFMPIGLAWHVGYSILAALFMWLLTRLAWPKELEQFENETPRRGETGGAAQ